MSTPETSADTAQHRATVPVGLLEVDGYRSLRKFQAGPFGRVNLLTGKNNCGKSSLLEAIWLWATAGSPDTLHSILNYREELSRQPERGPDEAPDYSADTPSYFRLFASYPTLQDQPAEIIIDVKDSRRSERRKLVMRIGQPDVQEEDVQRRLPGVYRRIGAGVPALLIECEGKPPSRMFLLPGDLEEYRFPGKYGGYRGHGGGSSGREKRFPSRFVTPQTGQRTGALSHLWDDIALTSLEQAVVDGLKLLSTDIEAVSMVGTGRAGTRTAIVKQKQHEEPVPLRSLGDGVNKIFGVLLALVNTKGGILLVDEFENGLHYSVQQDVWRVVFDLAAELDVQVFAATHSADCIKAFAKAAAAHEAEGVLTRLDALEDRVSATRFDEQELLDIAKLGIEVR